MQSRRDLVNEGVQKCQTATTKAVHLKTSQDPTVRELAEAIHWLSYGVQEIALALTEDGKLDDLPIQRH